MSWLRSREIPWIVTVLTGLLMLVPYYFGIPILDRFSSTLQNWTVVLLAFALGYGALSLMIVHSRNIVRRKAGWENSVALLVCLVGMIVTGAIPPFLSHPIFNWMYQYLQLRINQTTYALLAPFIASAAYRAFRARSIESTLMLVAGFFVMMMNAPIGGYLWTGFSAVGSWIYSIPNNAAQRGITIGIALGTLALGLRIFAGYERTFLGEERGAAGG